MTVAKLAAEDGEVVKTIGDAVLVRYLVPAAAVAVGLQIASDVMVGHGFPTVRVGMHHGLAVERDGDWFGGTVNVAARVAAMAAGGDVLLTSDVLEEAGELHGVTFESLGEKSLRNITAPIAVFAAVRDARSDAERHVDPVCRMVVTDGREAGRFRHGGTECRFCSRKCIRRCVDDPGAYSRR